MGLSSEKQQCPHVNFAASVPLPETTSAATPTVECALVLKLHNCFGRNCTDIAALHAHREAQGQVSSPVVVVVPPVPNQPPGPRIAATSHPIGNRKQERKYKMPICWRYAEKGHHAGPCKQRHISKDALALLPCPFFDKSAFCRFHETGQCWYGHGLPGADSRINLVSETPDLPQSDPDPPLPLTDFGTQTDSRLLFVDFGTQTQFMLPKPVLKTWRFHSSTQTIPVLACS